MTDRPAGTGFPRRLSHDTQVFLFALLVGLPGVGAGVGLVWIGAYSALTRWSVTLVVVLAWLVLAVALRERVVRPIQTLSNVLAAFREGDFSIRARGAGERGSLALAYQELNALESVLRVQRIGAVEASALLQKVLAEIDVAVFAFDEGDRLRMMNRAAERLVGRTEEEAVGHSASELHLDHVLRGPAPRTVELTHRGGSGRWEVRRSVARQEGQRLELVTLSDLSRALREEEREAWKRLVRVLSHEINNSLAPIKSISASLIQLLDREPRPDDWEDDLGRGLRVVGGRADALGRFMASYARLARLPKPEVAPVELEACVRHVAQLETRREVEVVTGPPTRVLADRDQLEQALINLVGNAVDAVEETGGGVRVHWRVRADQVEIDIEDDGPGLTDTANLFVPFYTTKPRGSGIGLVLSRQIAEAHGGTLVLDNRTEGPGARARFSLPLRNR